MKKVLISSFIILILSGYAKASEKWGEGELQLTEGTARYFIKYLRGNLQNRPLDFYVTTDGTDAIYWFCPTGGQCQAGNYREDIKHCNRATKKKCKKFASKRTIRWKNGINPAKGKASKINSKWSDNEILAKLTELGFYKNDFSKANKAKNTKTSTNLGNTVEQLETLTKLYESGALTEEEFKEAKKKILND